MTEQRAQRIANLTRAAQTKRQDAIARAEAGLRTLIKSNAAVNFRSVAEAGRVSLDFLYRNDDLRRRIEHLRAQHRPAHAHKQTSPPAEASSVVASLTAKLRDAHTETLNYAPNWQQHTVNCSRYDADPAPPPTTGTSSLQTRHQQLDQHLHDHRPNY